MSINKAAALPEEPGKTCSLNPIGNGPHTMAIRKCEVGDSVRHEKENEHDCDDERESPHLCDSA
jgi:hypothetical protein